MKLRVVGGPIRKQDRVVLDVTSNTTFEAILAMIYKQIEALDLADIAMDYFSASTTNALRGMESSHDQAFGTTIENEDDSSSTSGEEDEAHQQQSKPPRSVSLHHITLPRALSNRQCNSRPSGSTPNRLSGHPIDFAHYHIALLEFGPDDKPFATRLCKKGDTPRSVHMRVPVIGLFLRKAFKGTVAVGTLDVPNISLVGPLDSPPLDVLQIPPLGSPEPAATVSPLIRLSSPSVAGHYSLVGDGPPLSGGRDSHMSLSRLPSFGLYSATDVPSTSPALQRALALFRVPKSDVVQCARVQRVLKKVGIQNEERFLATAERALALCRDAHAVDALMIGFHFPLQNVKDVLTTCLTKLDRGTAFEAAYESASIQADMLVHAAPVGEEVLYATVFLGSQLWTYHERLRVPPTAINLRVDRWSNHSAANAGPEATEAFHRCIVERSELHSAERCGWARLILRFYEPSCVPPPMNGIGPRVCSDSLVWERTLRLMDTVFTGSNSGLASSSEVSTAVSNSGGAKHFCREPQTPDSHRRSAVRHRDPHAAQGEMTTAEPLSLCVPDAPPSAASCPSSSPTASLAPRIVVLEEEVSKVRDELREQTLLLRALVNRL